MRITMRTILALAALGAASAAAQVFGPSGGEFRVNAVTTGDQNQSTVAVDGLGRFFVLWSAADGDFTGVFGRRFAQSGAPIDATDFLVNAGTTGAQNVPAVAGSGNGNFVAVWRDDSGYEAISGQRYASLAEAGGVFEVLAPTSGSFSAYPAVAFDSSGDFVVAWNLGTAVNARLFGDAGAAIGGAFRVSETEVGWDARPWVARAPAGEFVVVWSKGYSEILGRRYDASGVAVGGEFTINTLTGNLSNARVATNGSGFIVAWQRFGTERSVEARLYDARWQPVGSEFRVNTSTLGGPTAPAVGMDGAGGFVVAWELVALQDEAIFAQRYAASGSPIGEEMRVTSQHTATLVDPAIAVAANGDFLVTWTRYVDAASGEDIHAQRYCHALAGNANGDSRIDVVDVFYLINALFAGGSAPIQSGDADGNGTLDVADVFYLINYVFAGGPAPACPS